MSAARRFTWEEHLAVFGGSFDPPHLGHFEAIQGLFTAPGVECVMIVPSATPPLKQTLTPFEHRFAMTKCLAESLSKFPIEMSAIERDEKVKFTWQLLKVLSQDSEQPLAFVIGADQFSQLEQWDRFPDVMGLCDWIVLLRKPQTLFDVGQSIQKYSQQGWLKPLQGNRFQIQSSGKTRILEFIETPAKNISSTEIRQNYSLGKGAQNAALVSASVQQYIERNKLYGASV